MYQRNNEKESRYTLKDMLNACDSLTEEESKKLIKKYLDSNRKDKETFNQLVKGFTRMVHSIIIKKYTNFLNNNNYCIDDLLSEGIQGVIFALNNYECQGTGKDIYEGFVAYIYITADSYIKSYIAENGSGLSINRSAKNNISNYIKIKEELKEKLNKDPSDEQIIDYVNNVVIPENRIGFKSIGKYNKEKILEYETYIKSSNPLSIYAFPSTNDDSEEDEPLFNLIEEKTDFNSEKYHEIEQELILFNELEKAVKKIKGKLDYKTRLDYILRYVGLGPYNEPQTLEEIGKIYNVSKQAVSSIVLDTFDKLKNNAYFKKLHHNLTH